MNDIYIVIEDAEPIALIDMVEKGDPGPPGESTAIERRHDSQPGGVENSLSFCGTAPIGSAESDPVWTIRRFSISVAGIIDTTETATNARWDQHLTANYT